MISKMPQMSKMPLKKQAGFTLIELMIALVLGLIIIAAVLNIYVGSSRSSIYTQGLQTMQENGRYGVSVLRRGIQLAGYSPEERPEDRVDAIDVDNSGNDFITVRMRRDFDCNGLDTAAAPIPGFAVNTYRFDSDKSIITCQGDQANSEAMTIVEGVDEFRVLYGLDEDADDVPEQFSLHNISMNSQDILAVRFAMLVNSGKEIRSQAIAEQHVVLDSIIPTNDRTARNVFGSTVILRNRQ